MEKIRDFLDETRYTTKLSEQNRRNSEQPNEYNDFERKRRDESQSQRNNQLSTDNRNAFFSK